ncbi:MAG: rhodanese-like domain-containing protein [Rhodoferax sp.]|jgi:rhodanese-related sulfurtransferase|nr:rhodanese-like domain-containing protein [Rhodoferax sp.]MBP9928423.1 rhodanese-like domain-containing protein [Rhodoferax sp.]HQX60329.1 rhodanese-like domain-containing protein [Burkholderiaceae bacterium]HQZ04585.1 rhodanese-like domain-containing protein [Burkholderiaceae bacterium]HRA61765.1 rhodanese-like domain-containing protein [Burkholderiaceae bacterium]
MAITRGYRQLVDEAMTEVTTYSVEQVRQRIDADPALQIVDIRDIRELSDGTIVGATHAPRGMLEFWVDPESPYHKPLFADEAREFVLFCGAGWRSALAAKALQDMGMTNVAHIDGGWAAWTRAGAPTESLEDNKARRKAKP